MSTAAEPSDYFPALIGLAILVIVISRLVRFARNTAPTPTPPLGHAHPRRSLWGPERKLERLQQTTAIVQTETELLNSTGEHLQARHNLDRLKAELEPGPPPRRLAPPATPALTVAEMRAVLDALDFAPELRATLLEMLEATANEKVRR